MMLEPSKRVSAGNGSGPLKRALLAIRLVAAIVGKGFVSHPARAGFAGHGLASEE